MSQNKIHPHSTIASLWTSRWEGNTIEELKASIERILGPFPLLFYVPGPEAKPVGVVMTGLMTMPGVADRPELPFLGASVVGYLPVQGHDGTVLKQLGNVKVAAWDTYVKPTEVERPEMVSGEMPEPSQ